MQLIDFLARVLPQSSAGYYVADYLHGNGFRQNRQDITTLRALADQVLQWDAQGTDTYVALGAFNKNSRKAENCLLKKCFYADVDVDTSGSKNKGGKEYATYSSKEEAFADIITKAEAKKIPTPNLIVDSGGGLHVYWVLETAITLQDWKPTAERLKLCLADAGLKIADLGITSDASRVLRPPETHNRKTGVAVPVTVVAQRSDNYTLERLRNAIPANVAPALAAVAPSVLPPPTELRLAGADLADDQPFNRTPPEERLELVRSMLQSIDPDKLGERDLWTKLGKAMKEIARATPSVPEDEWLALFTEFSAVAPGYEGEDDVAYYWHDTARGFDSRIGIGIGTLIGNALNSGWQWPARQTAEWGVSYPDGYVATAAGTFYVERDDETGANDWRKVTSMHFHNVSVAQDRYSPNGYLITARVVNPSDPSKHVFSLRTTTTALNASQTARRDFGNAGVFVSSSRSSRQLDELVLMMRSFVETIVAAGQARNGVAKFGWARQGEKDGFAAGDRAYWSDGTVTDNITQHVVMEKLYGRKGELAAWRDAAQFMADQNRQPINTLLASAFAAPLIPFTGVPGVVAAFVSAKSGTGKTTAMRAAQSVWGEPQRGMQQLDDTANSMIKRLEVLNNLPQYWDELRGVDILKQFIRFLFNVTQGKGKARLDSGANMMDIGAWQTMTCCASNESLRAHVEELVGSTDAGAMRLLEMEVPQVPDGNLANALRKFQAFDENYGVAGAAYAAALAKQKPVVKAIVAKVQDKFTDRLDPQYHERFWLAGISALYAGAFLATQLGILRFDLGQLEEYLVGVFEQHRRYANNDAPNAAGWVERFINSHERQVIVTDTMNLERGKGQSLRLINPGDPGRVVKPLIAHISQDGLVMVDQKALKRWLIREHSILGDGVVRELIRTGWVQRPATIGRGVDFGVQNVTRSTVLVTTKQNSLLDEVFEDWVEEG